MYRSESQWIESYKRKKALWIHDGNILNPHAVLTSGMHSAGFFNSRIVVENGELLKEAVEDLLEKVLQAGLSLNLTDVVVGPATGATKLAKFLARAITKKRGKYCFYVSPEKSVSGEKRMILSASDKILVKGAVCLMCEDVLTTGGSVELSKGSILEAEGIALDYTCVLVNRSGFSSHNGARIISLIARNMPIWTKEKCPLCVAGSEPVEKPKDNWDKLNVR